MKTDLRKIQLSRQLQEESYKFPYHYTVSFNSENYANFSQCRNNPGGYRYASYLIMVLEELENENFSSIVDIGCGDGFFVGKLFEKFTNKKIVGVDLSNQAISFAKVFNSDKNVEFLNMNIVDEDIGRKFDIATLIEVLEHIPPEGINDFLKSIHTMLNDNGKLILTVPSTNLSIKNIKRHFQHFDDKSLIETLSDYFEVTKIQYINKENFLTKNIANGFTNSFFVLNNDTIKNYLFSFYLKNFLKANKSNGIRLFAVCEKK